MGSTDLLTASSYLRTGNDKRKLQTSSLSSEKRCSLQAFSQDSRHRSQILLEDGMPFRSSRVFAWYWYNLGEVLQLKVLKLSPSESLDILVVPGKCSSKEWCLLIGPETEDGEEASEKRGQGKGRGMWIPVPVFHSWRFQDPSNLDTCPKLSPFSGGYS